ncbi:MAG: helix-turn-helix transcriptional regulator [Calditrichaeota bacterium]|nr:helix-turn-helix transcriptional regulator [Calditrichota bacterium]
MLLWFMKEKLTLAVTFGEVLKEERLRNNLSQEALAYASGLERNFISSMERGISQPTITTLFKLAEQLKISPNDLIQKVSDKK